MDCQLAVKLYQNLSQKAHLRGDWEFNSMCSTFECWFQTGSRRVASNKTSSIHCLSSWAQFAYLIHLKQSGFIFVMFDSIGKKKSSLFHLVKVIGQLVKKSRPKCSIEEIFFCYFLKKRQKVLNLIQINFFSKNLCFKSNKLKRQTCQMASQPYSINLCHFQQLLLTIEYCDLYNKLIPYFPSV